MATSRNMDIGLLRQLLTYDPDTGALTWLHRPDAKKYWETQYAGKPALTSSDHRGYRHGTILGRKHRSHRVAWALHYGEWPDTIDHINGVKDDNRICNLRSVTNRENNKNRPTPSDNTSGVMGVYWHNGRSKWCAKIRVERRCLHLGLFVNFDDAVAARKAAEIKYGYHVNHGRAAA